MDKETLDALDKDDAEGLKSLHSVYIDEKRVNIYEVENENDEFNTDEEDDMNSGYQLLPSYDPDESSDPGTEITDDEYERRKKEAFEQFDKNYAKVIDIFFNEIDL